MINALCVSIRKFEETLPRATAHVSKHVMNKIMKQSAQTGQPDQCMTMKHPAALKSWGMQVAQAVAKQ